MSKEIANVKIDFTKYQTFESLIDLRDNLVEACKNTTIITLDLGDTEKLNGASWQFILTFCIYCENKNVPLQICSVSKALRQQVKFLGLQQHLPLEDN